MRIGILGTGMVGQALGRGLIAAGHAVCMGSRTADNSAAAQWASTTGGSHGTFADAARFGELLINATNGCHSLSALDRAGADALGDRILIDVANPVSYACGTPPALFTGYYDSLAERIQRAFPRLRVVKTLNTVHCEVMIDPSRLEGAHALFLSSDDAEAKTVVRGLLTDAFGWQHFIDLGDLSTARGTESYQMLWIRLWKAFGHANFNLCVQSPSA